MDRTLIGAILIIGHIALLSILIMHFKRHNSLVNSILNPLVLFIIFYFFWLDTYYVLINSVNPSELVSASPYFLEYKPSVTLIVAYNSVAIVFIVGYFIFNPLRTQTIRLFDIKFLKITKRILDRYIISKVKILWRNLDRVIAKLTGTSEREKKWDSKLLRFLSVIWVASFICNIAIFFQVGGIPILEISLRSEINPILLTFALFQMIIIFVYAVALFGDSKLRTRRFALCFTAIVASTVVMSMLGARNIPLKIFPSVILFTIWSREFLKRKNLIIVTLIILMIGSVLVVGFFSKTQLYQREDVPMTGSFLEFIFTDVASSLFYFDKVITVSGPDGYYHGDLLIKTIISYIPGNDEYYANIHIGELVGFRPGEVSISSTINGPAFAELGWLGIIIQGLLVGFVLCYGWNKTKWNPFNRAPFSMFIAPIFITMTVGLYGLATWLTFALMIFGFWLFDTKVPQEYRYQLLMKMQVANYLHSLRMSRFPIPIKQKIDAMRNKNPLSTKSLNQK